MECNIELINPGYNLFSSDIIGSNSKKMQNLDAMLFF